MPSCQLFSAKKRLWKLSKTFQFIAIPAYFFPVPPFCEGAGKGNDEGVVAGAVGFEALSIVFCISGFPFFATPLLTEILMARDKTINEMANIQVPFSKKSPVFCTPINCDELEKLDVKPPPLGF
jgi:hypothetical protein